MKYYNADSSAIASSKPGGRSAALPQREALPTTTRHGNAATQHQREQWLRRMRWATLAEDLDTQDPAALAALQVRVGKAFLHPRVNRVCR